MGNIVFHKVKPYEQNNSITEYTKGTKTYVISKDYITRVIIEVLFIIFLHGKESNHFQQYNG